MRASDTQEEALENTGNLHEGQMTDHANKADTDFLLFITC
jgi:hypothetical protein